MIVENNYIKEISDDMPAEENIKQFNPLQMFLNFLPLYESNKKTDFFATYTSKVRTSRPLNDVQCPEWKYRPSFKSLKARTMKD